MVLSVRHYKEQNAKDETIDMRILRWIKRKIRNDRITYEATSLFTNVFGYLELSGLYVGATLSYETC